MGLWREGPRAQARKASQGERPSMARVTQPGSHSGVTFRGHVQGSHSAWGDRGVEIPCTEPSALTGEQQAPQAASLFKKRVLESK